ncbi:MAG TPA: hypothetical protein VIV09_05940, partial [Pseudolabrys sp.]
SDRSDQGAGREAASALTSATWVSAEVARFAEDTVLAVGNNLARTGLDAGRLAEAALVEVTARFVDSSDTARGAEGPQEGLELSGRSDVGAGRESAAGVDAGAAAVDSGASVETSSITGLGWYRSDGALAQRTVEGRRLVAPQFVANDAVDFLARKVGMRTRIDPVALFHQRVGHQQVGADQRNVAGECGIRRQCRRDERRRRLLWRLWLGQCRHRHHSESDQAETEEFCLGHAAPPARRQLTPR